MTNATSSRGPDTRAPAPAPGGTADLIYDAVVTAAVGGSVLALFFFAIDALAGRPLFTPSLIGTVLFTGANPSGVTEIRLDMVAYFSIVHFVAFGALGITASGLGRRTGLTRRPAALVAGILFVALSAGFLGVAGLLMPGLVSTIGLVRVLVGNLLTAVAMGLVLRWAHRDDAAPA